METFSALLPICAGNSPVPGTMIFKQHEHRLFIPSQHWSIVFTLPIWLYLACHQQQTNDHKNMLANALKYWSEYHGVYQHGLTLIPARISIHIYYKMWAEIASLFPNLNGVTVAVWEWISNFISHFPGHVITYQTVSNISLVKHSRKYTQVTDKIPRWLCWILRTVVKTRQPFATLVF